MNYTQTNFKAIEPLVSALSQLPEVEAIALGGSMANGVADATSDFDLYVYVSDMPSVAVREALLQPLSRELSVNVQDFGIEDIGMLVTGEPYELIYGNLCELSTHLQAVNQGFVQLGYTTCRHWTLIRSIVLFDRDGAYTQLQSEFSDYPDGLREAILAKNLPMLTSKAASFVEQLEKAIERGDWLSVNHRYSAIVASTADSLFALNHQYHPGEKRLNHWFEQLPIQPQASGKRLEMIAGQLYVDPSKHYWIFGL